MNLAGEITYDNKVQIFVPLFYLANKILADVSSSRRDPLSIPLSFIRHAPRKLFVQILLDNLKPSRKAILENKS